MRLTLITADPDLQPRVNGIDLRHVRDLEAGAEHWPPVSVVARGGRFVLVDGFHRLMKAKAEGWPNILVKRVPTAIMDAAKLRQ